MSREVLDYYQREKLRIQLKIADVRKKSDGGYDAYLAALTDALQQVDRVIKKHRQKHPELSPTPSARPTSSRFRGMSFSAWATSRSSVGSAKRRRRRRSNRTTMSGSWTSREPSLPRRRRRYGLLRHCGGTGVKDSATTHSPELSIA